MKTILIYAYECAPFHRPGSTIGAQRPYQFAKHLPKFGWRAIVLCCDFSRRYSLDPKGAWKEIVQQQVWDALESWNGSESLTIALPSLQYADWVDRLWLSTVILDPEKGIFAPKPGFGRGLVRKIATLLKLFRGDHSQSWQKVAVYAAETLQKRGLVVDTQLAAHGPDAGIYIARMLYSKLGWPFWIDFRDPVLQPMPRWIRNIYRLYLKRNLLMGAKGTINVNPVWVEMDQGFFGLPAFLVTNGFDLEEFQNIPAHSNEKCTTAYLGNISFPTNLEAFFSGLKRFKENIQPKQFAFVYRGNACSDIQAWADRYDVADLVDSKGPVSREEALQIMLAADLLILFSIDPDKEKDPFLRKGYYPGKVFEYFATGNPVLVTPGDDGALDNLIKSTQTGTIANTAEEVALILKNLYARSVNRTNKIMAPSSDLINQFSRENQTALLAGILDSTSPICAA